jgi:hypothetical protein
MAQARLADVVFLLRATAADNNKYREAIKDVFAVMETVLGMAPDPNSFAGYADAQQVAREWDASSEQMENDILYVVGSEFRRVYKGIRGGFERWWAEDEMDDGGEDSFSSPPGLPAREGPSKQGPPSRRSPVKGSPKKPSTEKKCPGDGEKTLEDGYSVYILPMDDRLLRVHTRRLGNGGELMWRLTYQGNHDNFRKPELGWDFDANKPILLKNLAKRLLDKKGLSYHIDPDDPKIRHVQQAVLQRRREEEEQRALQRQQYRDKEQRLKEKTNNKNKRKADGIEDIEDYPSSPEKNKKSRHRIDGTDDLTSPPEPKKKLRSKY